MADPIPKITLRLGETDWEGWTSADISMTMEAVAGSFTLGLTERWPGGGAKKPLSPGGACCVAVDGEDIVTGYIDDVSPFYADSQHGVQASGRDKTGDLVDCSAESNEWRALSLPALISEIVKPFGIEVVSEDDTGKPFEKFRIQEGEIAWAAIDRACKARAVLAMTDGLGRLVLTRATLTASDPIPVILGGKDGNILRGNGTFTVNHRHSKYRIKAQQGGELGTPEDRSHVVAEAEDPGITRYRPLTIIARDRMDAAAAKAQVQWEANVRRGRSVRASYVVGGWRDQAGRLWRPNTIVKVADDWVAINRDMLVVSVHLTIRDDTFETDLEVAEPSAYLPEPAQPEEEGVGW